MNAPTRKKVKSPALANRSRKIASERRRSTESSCSGELSLTRGWCWAIVTVIVSPNTDSGSFRWFAKKARIWLRYATNALESTRGAGQRSHVSWKSVSRSFDDAEPERSSRVSPRNADT